MAVTGTPPLASKRERTGWYFYDWAMSAFSTTVITVFLGPFLTSITKVAAENLCELLNTQRGAATGATNSLALVEVGCPLSVQRPVLYKFWR